MEAEAQKLRHCERRTAWHDGIIRVSGRHPPLERTGSTRQMGFMRPRRRRVTPRVIPMGGMTMLAGTPVAQPTGANESQEL